MKKGFTLSEVLITLVVIGVVAAISIPLVYSDWQRERTLTQLKKSYSVFANAMDLAILREGAIDTWTINAHTTGSWEFVEKYVLPYVNIEKDCKATTTNECAFNYTYLSRKQSGALDSENYRFILLDGTLAAVKVLEYTENGEKKVKPILTVDINGAAPPNMYGRDIFVFEYHDDGKAGKLTAYKEPELTREQTYTDGDSACNRNSKGEYCAALLMKDGWHFTKNYPW